MNDKFKRLLAGLVDFYISCLFGTVVVEVVTLGSGKFTFALAVIYAASVLASLALKDYVFKNASVGKRIFKLIIVKTDGTKLMTIDVIKRNIPFTFLWPVEVLLFVFNNERIGDSWAKTTVVSEQ